jgi:small-conductance mechanosensitive channel
MSVTLDQFLQWAVPASVIAGAFVIGLLFEWIVIKALTRVTRNTGWRWDDILAQAFSHAFIFWITITGAWFAVRMAPLHDELEGFLLRLLVATAKFIAVWVVARIVSGMVRLGMNGVEGVPTSSLIPNAVKIVIILIGFIFFLGDLGYDIFPIIGALGIGGLAAALAFQDTLANLFSGFTILASHKVRAGDYIQLNTGETGFVTDINWRETTIRDFSNNLVIIPNAQITSNIITNFNLPQNDIFVELIIGVGYDSDLEQVERVVKETAREVYAAVIGMELTSDPVFFYTAFADSAINFKLKVMVNRFEERMKVQHQLIKAIHRRFQLEGIEIPFPQRTVHFAAGEPDR